MAHDYDLVLFETFKDIIDKLENGETISEKTIVMDEKGFDDYMAGFTACIPAQQAAVDGWKA